MPQGCVLSKAGWWLVILGGVNWGLVGAGGFLGVDLNIVHMALASGPSAEYGVYLIIGLAAIMTLVGCPCTTCKAACAPDAPKP